MYYLLLAIAIAYYLIHKEKINIQKIDDLQNHQLLLMLSIPILLCCEYYNVNVLQKLKIDFCHLITNIDDNDTRTIDPNDKKEYNEKQQTTIF